MANKLRNKTARVSFFSFQDMITTVTGVLMVVMMRLSLDMTRQASSPAAVSQASLRRTVEQARQQLATHQDTLAQLQIKLGEGANRVFVIPEPDPSGKNVVLVVIFEATNGYFARLGQTDVTEFKVENGRTSFKQVLDACDINRDRLVFYVRPSGINHFRNLPHAGEEPRLQLRL